MSFVAGEFLFFADDGFTVVELEAPASLHVDDLDAVLDGALAQRGWSSTQRLGGAPLASWVLARLAALGRADRRAARGRADYDETIELVDDAVFVRDWVVALHRAPAPRHVAKLQVQGGMIGIGLLGVQERSLGRRVLDGLVAALVDAPDHLTPIRVRVRDPDWREAPADYRPVPGPETTNIYGWDGERFLGTQNVRPRGDLGIDPTSNPL